MAETPNVMPSLHMPLQSGSDAVLKRMRRSYRREKYLGIIDRVREQIPDAAITTDIIVGFPGETEDDFAQTLDVVRRARFSSAFTFQYSVRAGTPAADHGRAGAQAGRAGAVRTAGRPAGRGQLGRELGQVGRRLELLVAEGEGRKDGATHRMSGRARDNRLVHFVPPLAAERRRSAVPGRRGRGRGDVRGARTTWSATRPVLAVRPTRSGDAWQARTAEPVRPAVGLGMPTVGAPR